jgi:hypothetical protein
LKSWQAASKYPLYRSLLHRAVLCCAVLCCAVHCLYQSVRSISPLAYHCRSVCGPGKRDDPAGKVQVYPPWGDCQGVPHTSWLGGPCMRDCAGINSLNFVCLPRPTPPSKPPPQPTPPPPPPRPPPPPPGPPDDGADPYVLLQQHLCRALGLVCKQRCLRPNG